MCVCVRVCLRVCLFQVKHEQREVDYPTAGSTGRKRALEQERDEALARAAQLQDCSDY